MKQFTNVPLTDFTEYGVVRDGNVCTFPGNGSGYLEMTFDAGRPFGMEVSEKDFISMDITCHTPRSVGIFWEFRCADGRYARIKMGLLPNIRTRIALPFSVVSGKNLFLPRTPGKLKSVFEGIPVDFREVTAFRFYKMVTLEDIQLELDRFEIRSVEPEYPVETKALVDEMGQKAVCDWPGKTKSVEEMRARLTDELNNPPFPASPGKFSRFGGDLSNRLTEGTGYFALAKRGERYVLCDPEGYEFFSTGLDCVGIDGDCNLKGIRCLAGSLPETSPGWKRDDFFSWHTHNLYQVFGDEYYEKWCALTAARMKKWGFNTVACWSDIKFAEKYKMPHTYIMGGYPRTETYIFRDFPDVFSPDFETNADEWAKQILPHSEKPELIGYFLGNEPNWAFVNGLNIAAMVLGLGETTWSRKKLIGFMAERYGTVEALNEAWGSVYTSFEDMDRPVKVENLTEKAAADLMDFSCEMIREYIRIPSAAIRKYDRNHLNLGIRYAWLSSKALASGSEYTDVFSFNCYSMDPYEAIENFSAIVNKPVMIGEFHFGALDRGLDATGIRGVTTQEERGYAYRYYMHRAASHPMCLGAHYFTLNDQAYLGRFDGENYQIGVVDVTQRPYEDFERLVIETNAGIYSVVNGEEAPTTRKAEEIPAIFF